MSKKICVFDGKSIDSCHKSSRYVSNNGIRDIYITEFISRILDLTFSELSLFAGDILGKYLAFLRIPLDFFSLHFHLIRSFIKFS